MSKYRASDRDELRAVLDIKAEINYLYIDVGAADISQPQVILLDCCEYQCHSCTSQNIVFDRIR